MNDIKKVGITMALGVPLILFLVLFLVLLSNQSASGDESVVIVGNSDFSIPFTSKDVFSVSSKFGYRNDPFEKENIKFHSGIDLKAPMGTDVIASADGIVYEISLNETSLGNCVYIKHQTSDGTLFTVYGHMMDNSIVVEKNQIVTKGQKIGQVGSTGRSTGSHLHFSIMKNKVSFKSEDLIDPHFVINGLY